VPLPPHTNTAALPTTPSCANHDTWKKFSELSLITNPHSVLSHSMHVKNMSCRMEHALVSIFPHLNVCCWRGTPRALLRRRLLVMQSRAGDPSRWTAAKMPWRRIHRFYPSYCAPYSAALGQSSCPGQEGWFVSAPIRVSKPNYYE